MKTPVTRRTFLAQTGVLAGGVVLGASAVPVWGADSATTGNPLPRRVLGRTGVSVTTMTLGTAPSGCARPHSPENVAACVNAALDLGVNAIDTAPAYEVGEEGVGLGLGPRRKEVFLSSKVLADTVTEAEKILSNSLKVLKTDYLDLAYFHSVGDRKVEVAQDADGVFTWLLKQKQAGRIRFVGISGHNRPAKFLALLESAQVDVLLTIINFVDRFTYRFEETVLPVARKHNVGIVAMKVFGGSRNMNYADPHCPPHLEVGFLELAVRHSLNVAGVATLNLGAHTVEQVRQNVAMLRQFRPLTPEETDKLSVQGRELAQKWGPHFGPIA